jgi:hypothetical protein
MSAKERIEELVIIIIGVLVAEIIYGVLFH